MMRSKAVAIAFIWMLRKALADTATKSTTSRELSSPGHVEDCPPCDAIFSKLKTTASGRRAQDVEMIERGEPKSGTTFMFEWARGALERTCDFLEHTYGEGTCRVDTERLGPTHHAFNTTLIFDPSLGNADRKCLCEDVELVQISVTDFGKHQLPVTTACRWWHDSGIPRVHHGCNTVAGREVENFTDIKACLREADCVITDDREQFAPLREPRAAAVSTYFHIKAHREVHKGHHPVVNLGVDDGVKLLLPVVCKWLSIRYLLFEESLMADKSTTFWYQDAKDEPVQWHKRWMESVGLQLPPVHIDSMAAAAVNGSFAFKATTLNIHPGGETAETKRTWQDEVSPELLPDMEAIMRLWLPPALLARFGVTP